MSINYYTVDVFTEHAFHGVPLSVITEAETLNLKQKQQIANELCTANTVFLTQKSCQANHYAMDVFSPQKQLTANTHTVLAASYTLAATKKIILKEQHTLITLSDDQQEITTYVSKNKQGQATLVQQTYHTHAAIDYYTPTVNELAAMLSLTPADIGFDKYRPLIVSCGVPYLIVPIKSYRAIRAAKFNEAAWGNSSAPSALAQEILLFANNTDDNPADFHTRLLGPAIAQHEDPPIGGAIAAFANHICSHDHIQAGTHVFAIQRGANDARKSFFYIEMDNKKSNDLTIRVGGYAVLMSKAQLLI